MAGSALPGTALPNPIGNGNAIFVFFFETTASSLGIASIAQVGGSVGGFTKLSGTPTNRVCEVWASFNVPNTASQTITPTLTGAPANAPSVGWCIVEWPGVTALDVQAVFPGTGTTISLGPLTPTLGLNQVIFAAARGGTPVSPTAGWTAITSAPVNSAVSYWVDPSTSGSYSMTYSQANTTYGGVMVAITGGAANFPADNTMGDAVSAPPPDDVIVSVFG